MAKFKLGYDVAPSKPKQRVERVDWLKIAQLWYAGYEGEGATLYAGEIVDRLKECGMIKSQHSDVVEWAKSRDKEDRRP